MCSKGGEGNHIILNIIKQLTIWVSFDSRTYFFNFKHIRWVGGWWNISLKQQRKLNWPTAETGKKFQMEWGSIEFKKEHCSIEFLMERCYIESQMECCSNRALTEQYTFANHATWWAWGLWWTRRSGGRRTPSSSDSCSARWPPSMNCRVCIKI